MTGTAWLERLRDLLPDAEAILPGAVDRATRDGGAYLLLLRLDRPVPFSRGTMQARLSGPLLYAGSAHGPGGIRARLMRHFRPDKKAHWHVDELTKAATPLAALSLTGGSECAIVDRLIRSGLYEPALAGFGSSDCRRCAAHLLRPSSGG